MKLYYLLLFSIILFSCKHEVQVNVVTNDESQSEIGQFYQLKIYRFENTEQLQRTSKYLETAFLPTLKELGYNNVGVFQTLEDVPDSLSSLYILIPFKKFEDIFKLDQELANNKSLGGKGADYINATYDNPPYNRIESVILHSFKDMPEMRTPSFNTPKSERIYELRSYESATEALYHNKVDMFNEGGEIKLFEKLEFNAVFYAEVISGNSMPNLMYMTTFENRDSRDAHWKSFVDSEDWKKLKSDPKYQNNVSHADVLLLRPTNYSDY